MIYRKFNNCAEVNRKPEHFNYSQKNKSKEDDDLQSQSGLTSKTMLTILQYYMEYSNHKTVKWNKRSLCVPGKLNNLLFQIKRLKVDIINIFSMRRLAMTSLLKKATPYIILDTNRQINLTGTAWQLQKGDFDISYPSAPTTQAI